MSAKFLGMQNSFVRKQARRRRALERFHIIPHDDTMMTGDEHAAYIIRKNEELQSLRRHLNV